MGGKAMLSGFALGIGITDLFLSPTWVEEVIVDQEGSTHLCIALQIFFPHKH